MSRISRGSCHIFTNCALKSVIWPWLFSARGNPIRGSFQRRAHHRERKSEVSPSSSLPTFPFRPDQFLLGTLSCEENALGVLQGQQSRGAPLSSSLSASPLATSRVAPTRVRCQVRVREFFRTPCPESSTYRHRTVEKPQSSVVPRLFDWNVRGRLGGYDPESLPPRVSTRRLSAQPSKPTNTRW